MMRRNDLPVMLLATALVLWTGATPAGAGVEEVYGETGPGALYAFHVPDGMDGNLWNGDLVVYTHGYLPADSPVQLPEAVAPLRDAWLQMGYAVACSSYSENGYALKRGVQQTHQLRGLFVSRFGQPRRTYLVGHSLGGIITLMLAEKYPGHYDGALPMCGQLGGTAMVAEYVANLRVLFDYYFPGVIPGSAMEVPEGLDFERDVVPAVMAALITDPVRAFEMAGVDQIRLPVLNFDELVRSVLHVLGYQVKGTRDFLARCHGHYNFDNAATAYTGSADDAALNEGVDRFESRPDAVNFMDHYYQPDGDLKIPVLTLHTTRDPLVPFVHEAAYAEMVEAAGASDLLVQQQVDRFGHCKMTGMETFGAFLDLIGWVEYGVVPPGGDVTSP